VSDEHNRDDLSAKVSDEIKHVSRLPHVERSHLLVKEHHAPDGASDRDALALAPGEILNALPNGYRSADPDLIEDRAGARASLSCRASQGARAAPTKTGSHD
jgi:hypothetical protein